MRPTGVLGGGAWGTMVARLVATAGRRAVLWLRDPALCEEIRKTRRNPKYTGDCELPPLVEPTCDLAAAAACDVIFAAVPLKAFRDVANRLGEHVTGDKVLISCSKGLEAGTHRRPTEILKEETCAKKIGVLSGPNLSAEIGRGEPSAAVIASRFREVRERGREAIMGPRFRVYDSDDVLGVELAGAMKNIVALGAGITHGLGFGANSLATIITRGLAEIARYGVAAGAQPLTFSGLAGVGDLVATCSSPLSRNHQVGLRIAKGEKLEKVVASMVQTAEGVNTTRVVVEDARARGIEMPLTDAVYRMLFDEAAPLDVLAELMGRPATKEIEFA